MDTVPPTAAARIFVSVASYRDSECPWTLADLFAKAAHPDRVCAGVLWQVAPDDPVEWCRVPPERSDQVRGITVEADSSLGVCWARSRIQSELWQGEEYYLQVDSHSRFAPGWDTLLLEVLAACPSPRPVLTTHPIGYEPPDKLTPDVLPILTAGRFNDTGVLMPKAKGLAPPFVPDRPAPPAFVGAGLV
ncbi:MAG: UDP-N-acetylglucosamine-transferase, partial [Magnetococcus sp. DMHC-8]